MASLNKGRAWEYRMHSALFAAGWYLRRNVDLRERIAGSPQTMAEIDLLGLGFDVELRPIRLVGECKDRKGSTKEADRVIWLLGLGRLLDAGHLVFAKPSIGAATLRFARSLPVSLFDDARVNEIEGQYDPMPVAGAFDPVLGEQVIRPAVQRTAFRDARLREAYDWIHNGFWYETSRSRVKRLPGYFRLVLEKAKDETRTVMIVEGVLGLLASALDTAGQLRRYSPAVGNALLEEGLASGVASASALREIAARADDYYRDVLERSVENLKGEKSEVRVPRLADSIAQPPGWTDLYLAYCRRLSARPEAAADLLRFAELELLERWLAVRDPRSAQAPLIRTDHAWHSNALALTGAFLERAWDLSDPHIASLLHPDSSAGDGSVSSTDVSSTDTQMVPTPSEADGQESLLESP